MTRADVMRALAAMADAMLRATSRSQDDEAIRRQLCEELSRQAWWSDSGSNVFVHKGIVNYVGVYEREIDKEAARIAAVNIPGVRGVQDQRTSFGDWQPIF